MNRGKSQPFKAEDKRLQCVDNKPCELRETWYVDKISLRHSVNRS